MKIEEQVKKQLIGIYHSAHIKVLSSSQILKTSGSAINDNQLKLMATELYLIYCQLQKHFEQAHLDHIFEVCKIINHNYVAIVMKLLMELQHIKGQTPMGIPNKEKMNSQPKQDMQTVPIISNDVQTDSTVKLNRFGGVHLYNQSYIRGIENLRIIEELQNQKQSLKNISEKEKLRQLIFAELEDKTDVEVQPIVNDDISDYIKQTRNKESMFNYTPSDSELQRILSFVNQSEKDVNGFLNRVKFDNYPQLSDLSFTEVEKDMAINSQHVVQTIIHKLKQFLQKIKKRQKELSQTLNKQKECLKQTNEHINRQKATKEVQTDSNESQRETMIEQLKLRCQTLQQVNQAQMSIQHKNIDLQYQISVKVKDLNKKNIEIKEQMVIIEKLKRILRQGKINLVDRELDITQSRNGTPTMVSSQKDTKVFEQRQIKDRKRYSKMVIMKNANLHFNREISLNNEQAISNDANQEKDNDEQCRDNFQSKGAIYTNNQQKQYLDRSIQMSKARIELEDYTEGIRRRSWDRIDHNIKGVQVLSNQTLLGGDVLGDNQVLQITEQKDQRVIYETQNQFSDGNTILFSVQENSEQGHIKKKSSTVSSDKLKTRFTQQKHQARTQQPTTSLILERNINFAQGKSSKQLFSQQSLHKRVHSRHSSVPIEQVEEQEQQQQTKGQDVEQNLGSMKRVTTYFMDTEANEELRCQLHSNLYSLTLFPSQIASKDHLVELQFNQDYLQQTMQLPQIYRKTDLYSSKLKNLGQKQADHLNKVKNQNKLEALSVTIDKQKVALNHQNLIQGSANYSKINKQNNNGKSLQLNNLKNNKSDDLLRNNIQSLKSKTLIPGLLINNKQLSGLLTELSVTNKKLKHSFSELLRTKQISHQDVNKLLLIMSIHRSREQNQTQVPSLSLETNKPNQGKQLKKSIKNFSKVARKSGSLNSNDIKDCVKSTDSTIQVQTVFNNQSLTEFASTFKDLHRNCTEAGPICAHIQRYIEFLLKNIEAKKGKKQHVSMHIQQIGTGQFYQHFQHKSAVKHSENMNSDFYKQQLTQPQNIRFSEKSQTTPSRTKNTTMSLPKLTRP